jgi:hypothetical protein
MRAVQLLAFLSWTLKARRSHVGPEPASADLGELWSLGDAG